MSERTLLDLLFKYFFVYKPKETKLIDPSLLTVFRCECITRYETNDNGERVKIKDSFQELINEAKKLRRAVYEVDESMRDKMPKRKESTGLLENQINYTKELIKIVEDNERLSQLPNTKEKIEYLKIS